MSGRGEGYSYTFWNSHAWLMKRRFHRSVYFKRHFAVRFQQRWRHRPLCVHIHNTKITKRKRKWCQNIRKLNLSSSLRFLLMDLKGLLYLIVKIRGRIDINNHLVCENAVGRIEGCCSPRAIGSCFRLLHLTCSVPLKAVTECPRPL